MQSTSIYNLCEVWECRTLLYTPSPSTSSVQKSQSQSPFPRLLAHKAVPITVSIALGHASAKVTAGAGPLVAPPV